SHKPGMSDATRSSTWLASKVFDYSTDALDPQCCPCLDGTRLLEAFLPFTVAVSRFAHTPLFQGATASGSGSAASVTDTCAKVHAIHRQFTRNVPISTQRTSGCLRGRYASLWASRRSRRKIRPGR